MAKSHSDSEYKPASTSDSNNLKSNIKKNLSAMEWLLGKH